MMRKEGAIGDAGIVGKALDAGSSFGTTEHYEMWKSKQPRSKTHCDTIAKKKSCRLIVHRKIFDAYSVIYMKLN